MAPQAALDPVANLEAVALDTIAKDAARVDKEGVFPQAGLNALAKAGLMGLISSREVGGLGEGIRAATAVVERIARECGSTAMVLCMHYCGAAVLEKLGPQAVRKDIAAGKHLSTLAFSEAGSRSHFWAPVSEAKSSDSGTVTLNARKSWITSAGHATAYVWSSRPLAGKELSTLWLVPRDTPGLRVAGHFDGLGLRGNDSSPLTAEGVRLPATSMLGADGAGFGAMMEIVLPFFNAMNAAVSVGLMEAAVTRTIAHVQVARFEQDGSSLRDLPTIRAYLARMRVKADMARALLADSISAIESARPDAMLRVLECKVAAADAATEVLATAMRVCGGAAFRRDVGVERYFRDAQAATVMGPTTDVLYDFIGKAITGLSLF